MMVDEYGKYVDIRGYRLREAVDPKPFIDSARSVCHPALAQFFDAGKVDGREHLFFAAVNAIKTFSQGRNIAETLDVEVLLYV